MIVLETVQLSGETTGRGRERHAYIQEQKVVLLSNHHFEARAFVGLLKHSYITLGFFGFLFAIATVNILEDTFPSNYSLTAKCWLRLSVYILQTSGF